MRVGYLVVLSLFSVLGCFGQTIASPESQEFRTVDMVLTSWRDNDCTVDQEKFRSC